MQDLILSAQQSLYEIIATLKTSAERGLLDDQIPPLLATWGPNELEKEHNLLLKSITNQLLSHFLILYYIIIGLSLASGQYDMAAIVAGCVVVTISVGCFQEYRATKDLDLLKTYLISSIHVIRNGSLVQIPSTQLVPGDIIMLYPGDIIPADVRFIEDEQLVIDESSLTGESAPVQKMSNSTQHVTNIFATQTLGFCGTAIQHGKAKAVVLATGKHTLLSAIAHTAPRLRPSSLTKDASTLGKAIMYLAATTISIIFCLHLFLKESVNFMELASFSIALILSIIPEALLVVITFCLARGAALLARHKVIVKNLAAIEELGKIEILCTDKTGTITENALALIGIYGADEKKVRQYAALNIQTELETLTSHKDFDGALHTALTPEDKEALTHYRRLREIPFDPVKRKNISLVLHDGSINTLIARGACEVILPLCSTSEQERNAIHAWITEQESNGNRVIAVASKDISLAHPIEDSIEPLATDMSFCGALAFADPLKKTSYHLIENAQALGVSIKILSGDSPYVCGSIAKHVNLIKNSSDVITGQEYEKKSEQEKDELVFQYHVFARIAPEQKLDIIQRLQKKYVVGYLGDGINDTPALHAAHVAITVQNATSIAREASDIILLKKSLTVIIDGIREGRTIVVNTLKYLYVTVIAGCSNFYALSTASLLLPYMPMLPAQIVFINLLTDFPMIGIATDAVATDDIKKTKTLNMPQLAVLCIILGGIGTIADFVFFFLFYHQPPAVLQTGWFIMSTLSEMALFFSIRTKGLFYKAHLPPLLLCFFITSACLIAILLPYTRLGVAIFEFHPLSLVQLGIVASVVAGYFVVTECTKYLCYKYILKR